MATETEITQFNALPQTVRDAAMAYRATMIAEAERVGVSVEDELRALIRQTVILESETLRHVQSDFTPEDGRAYWQSETQRLFAQRIALGMSPIAAQIVMAAGLQALCRVLRSAGTVYDSVMGSLPSYGGAEPASTTGVWSWDADSLLVGTCASDLRIVPRSER